MKTTKRIVWDPDNYGPYVYYTDLTVEQLVEERGLADDMNTELDGVINIGDSSVFPIGYEMEKIADMLLASWLDIDGRESNKIVVMENDSVGASAHWHSPFTPSQEGFWVGDMDGTEVEFEASNRRAAADHLLALVLTKNK